MLTQGNTALRTGDDFENCCVHACRCVGATVLIAQGAHTEAREQPQGLILAFPIGLRQSCLLLRTAGELFTDPGLPHLCLPLSQSILGM